MDPDEGGGTPPPPPVRRSRRQQNLNPMTTRNDFNHANDNNTHTLQSVVLEDASQSQYQSRNYTTPYQQSHHSSTNLSYASSQRPIPTVPRYTNDDDASTLPSVYTSHRHSRSSDPPEETFGVASSNKSAYSNQPGNSASSRAPTSYRSASPYPLPDTIQVHDLHTPSSITQPATYVNSETYQTLQDTVMQLQHDFTTFQTSSTQQNTHIQREMNVMTQRMQSQHDNMHHAVTNAVTNAVVEAMKQFQSSPHPIPPSPSPQQPTPVIPTTTSSVTVPTSHINHAPDPLTSTPMPSSTSNIHVPMAPSPYQNITSPIPHLTEQGTIDNPITLADLVQMTSSPKCSFPVYTKNQNIFEWRTVCLLELAGSSKPAHRNMVIVNDDGKMVFQTNLSIRDKQELFRMTKKALSTKLNTNFITVDVINRADGIQLWDMILQEFQPLPKDEMELEDMKQAFLNLSKSTTENDQTYLERF